MRRRVAIAVGLIVLVVFGHNRIPQLGEALGKGIKNFRKSFAKDEKETQPTERVAKLLEISGAMADYKSAKAAK